MKKASGITSTCNGSTDEEVEGIASSTKEEESIIWVIQRHFCGGKDTSEVLCFLEELRMQAGP